MTQAMPGDARYRHFSRVARLASRYGTSSDTMREVVKDVEGFGLDVAVDRSRLFARGERDGAAVGVGSGRAWCSRSDLKHRPSTRR